MDEPTELFDELVTRLAGVEAWQATKAERQKERVQRRTRGRSF